MKDFLEEYGGMVVGLIGAIIIIVALISMTFGSGKSGFNGSFGRKIISILDQSV
jgi:hypothetical protein